MTSTSLFHGAGANDSLSSGRCILSMLRPRTNVQITVTDKIISCDDVPDCFIDRAASREHFNSWAETVVEVVEGADAYADNDDEDHSGDPIINYNCVAWE